MADSKIFVCQRKHKYMDHGPRLASVENWVKWCRIWNCHPSLNKGYPVYCSNPWYFKRNATCRQSTCRFGRQSELWGVLQRDLKLMESLIPISSWGIIIRSMVDVTGPYAFDLGCLQRRDRIFECERKRIPRTNVVRSSFLASYLNPVKENRTSRIHIWQGSMQQILSNNSMTSYESAAHCSGSQSLKAVRITVCPFFLILISLISPYRYVDRYFWKQIRSRWVDARWSLGRKWEQNPQSPPSCADVERPENLDSCSFSDIIPNVKVKMFIPSALHAPGFKLSVLWESGRRNDRPARAILLVDFCLEFIIADSPPVFICWPLIFMFLSLRFSWITWISISLRLDSYLPDFDFWLISVLWSAVLICLRTIPEIPPAKWEILSRPFYGDNILDKYCSHSRDEALPHFSRIFIISCGIVWLIFKLGTSFSQPRRSELRREVRISQNLIDGIFRRIGRTMVRKAKRIANQVEWAQTNRQHAKAARSRRREKIRQKRNRPYVSWNQRRKSAATNKGTHASRKS
jgi:hypothetical protein